MNKTTSSLQYLHPIACQSSDLFVCFFLPASLYLLRISDTKALSAQELVHWLLINGVAYGIVYALTMIMGWLMPYLIGEEISLAGGRAIYYRVPTKKRPRLLQTPFFILFPFQTQGFLLRAKMFLQPPWQSRGQPTQIVQSLKSARPFLLFQVAPLRIP